MGITRALIGAVAAAGVARLLAPHETDAVVKSAKSAVSSIATTPKRKQRSTTGAAKTSSRKTSSRKTKPAKSARKPTTTTKTKTARPLAKAKAASRPGKSVKPTSRKSSR